MLNGNAKEKNCDSSSSGASVSYQFLDGVTPSSDNGDHKPKMEDSVAVQMGNK